MLAVSSYWATEEIGTTRPLVRASRYDADGPGEGAAQPGDVKLLRDEGAVKILKFDDAMLKALHEISKEAVAAAGAGDDISRRIYASYQRFRGLVTDWSDVSERTYLNSRRLV